MLAVNHIDARFQHIRITFEFYIYRVGVHQTQFTNDDDTHYNLCKCFNMISV